MSRYTTQKYDTKKYNFVEIIRRLFIHSLISPPACTNELNVLHELTRENYGIFEIGKDSSTIFHKIFYDKYHSGWAELQDLYDAFIKEIVAPQYNEDILYQKFPTFRVHLPNSQAVSLFHNDSEFHHPIGEINYIVPLTDSEETSSVYVESEEGKKDYEPMSLKIGELVMFNGNKLSHGNKTNITGKTRVSFDFRVLPSSIYNENDIGVSLTLHTKFKEGEYYKRLSK